MFWGGMAELIAKFLPSVQGRLHADTGGGGATARYEEKFKSF